MKRGRAVLRGYVRATLAAAVAFGVPVGALGLDAESRSAVERIQLFTPADSRGGVATLEFEVGILPLLSKANERFVVERFPLQRDRQVELDLHSFRVTSDRTRFVLGRRNRPDIPLAFDPSGIVLLTGTVVDHPGSDVFIALSETLSTGKIYLGPGGETYLLSSELGQGRPPSPGQVAIFRATRSGAGAGIDVPLCGIDLVEANTTPRGDARGERSGSTSSSGTGPIKGMRTIELAIETDYEYFQLFPNAAAAATYATMLLGGNNHAFMRDANYRFELTYLRLWDTPDDLFNEPNGIDAFNAFVGHWQTNMGAVQRDTTQYLSGRRDLPFGGIAYLSVICTNFGYSMAGYLLGFFPDPDVPSVYHYDIEVSAHELGHNCGTHHTDTYSPPIDRCFPPPGIPQRGTIMSYCGQGVSGGNAVHELRFHARVQQTMRNFLSAAVCVIDDCNLNNVADATDIANLTSPDVNRNGIPDECEDCDGDGVLDPDEIAGGAADLNVNGIPDVCEPDCNNNNIPDDRDILLNTSTDAYGNNIPDECEADCNGNGISDFTEIQADLKLDINRNALLDSCDDCDGDGIPDAQELDGAHNVWIASDLLDVIGEYHAETGVLVKNAEGGRLTEPQDVAIDKNGRIFVSSALDDRVVEFDRSGAYVGDFVTAASGGLEYPTGLLLLPGGNLLVSSRDTNSVIEYDGDTGAHVGAFVSAGSGGLIAPFGLALNPDGHLFVTSADNQVIEYDGATGAPRGVFVSSVDNGGLSDPRGLAFKPDGNLLVAGYASDAVNEYDRDTGAFVRVFHNGGTVYGPWGVRLAPNGNVFLTRDYEIGAGFQGGQPGGTEPLHATTTRIYEYDPITGNHLRSYLLGDDTGLSSPTGFAFMPGSATDCNVNFVLDSCDIAAGTSVDLNQDGIPDECGACCQGAQCEQLARTACAVQFGQYRGNLTTCDQGCGVAIPAMSEWGVLVLVIVLLTALTFVFSRRPEREQE